MSNTYYSRLSLSDINGDTIADNTDWQWSTATSDGGKWVSGWAEPAARPRTALKARIEVDEDGALHLIPEDAAAAFFLHDRALNHSISHMGTSNGPGNPFRFKELTIARKVEPTLTRDGSRHTEQRLIPQDYDAVKKLVARLAAQRAKAAASPVKRRPKKRGGK